MLREITEQLIGREDLSFDQSQSALDAILDGQCSGPSIAGFLTALSAKGERPQEIAGMALSLREHAVPVRPKVSSDLLDTCGTGGDGQDTFNISTIAAIVAAASGVAVAKHGNRAITSKCGSADLLAELGVKIDAVPAVIARCIECASIGFMFAPNHHPAMKYVQPIRKSLGYRTAFNILGPLANPANVTIQIIGVAKAELAEVMAEAARLLGSKRVMIVHGQGLDELATCGPTDIVELRDGNISKHTVDYSDYGFEKASLDDLRGGSLSENAEIARGILANKLHGPKRDIVLLNAAAAIMLGGAATGLAEGIKLAGESIDSGRAAETLGELVEISNS